MNVDEEEQNPDQTKQLRTRMQVWSERKSK
jgi:hypothetical protein